jgi:hypothetical protein
MVHEGSVLQGWRRITCGDWLGCREVVDDIGPLSAVSSASATGLLLPS